MDFMHILGQKEAIWNTIFSIFERRRGPPSVAGPGKTFPLFPPSRRACIDCAVIKEGGFFVECVGWMVRLSNTAFLERRRNWEGLLIEMDPFFYTQLLGKNRRVWSINACLSPCNYFTTACLLSTILYGLLFRSTWYISRLFFKNGPYRNKFLQCW